MQRWINREISNFEYLMQLNTMAGRSFNDLSQYPVFPWILADYESEKLDLTKAETFRDLSKPIGVQNVKHVDEVLARYENFDDPTGVIKKFHYGTHYSNSAMVLHYLVRVEPFSSLHVELQSGRFDVADRQFHSITQTWKSLYENLNDVKELIPEFFYFPEFLQNLNNFDLGKLQGKKKPVHDVILPKWAKNPYDFIRKHRLALESEYVSANLHSWIDLIFGHKQKGPAAVDALNVFYYCSYEGAVNLEAISDPAEREAVEGMINNFGQTPCQLLKAPHPKRLSIAEFEETRKTAKPGNMKVDILVMPHKWKAYSVDMTDEKDPLVLIRVPSAQEKIGGGFIAPDPSESVITVSQSGAVGVHSFLPYDKTGQTSFTFERDSTLDPQASTSKKDRQRTLPPPLTPNLNVNRKIIACSHDAKFIFYGGSWDNGLQVYSIAKAKIVSKVVRHIDVVTAVNVDMTTGNYVITGSRDTTSIIWEVYGQTNSSNKDEIVDLDFPNPRPLQVLGGHDKTVTCVALSTELDMAVSGSDDGSINVYTAKEGQYIRSIFPPTFGSDVYTVSALALSYQGHVVFTGHSKDVHSLHVYTVNGHLLTSSSAEHRISCLAVVNDFVVSGDENGDLVLRDLLTPKILHRVPLHLPVQDVFAVGTSHILAPLRDGKLVIIGLKN